MVYFSQPLQNCEDFKLLTKKSNTIDYLKALAAIFVVVHHAILYVQADAHSVIWLILRNAILNTHVPLFLVIAGFLCYRQNFKTYIQKKILRILVPFFLFSGLKLFYSIFISSEFSHGTTIGAQIFSAFVCGSLYWFPYAILLIYCFAVLYWTSKNETPTLFKKVAVPVTIVCLVLINRRYYLPGFKALTYFQLGSAVRFFVFFLIGMFLRQHSLGLAAFYNRKKYMILPCCLVLMAVTSWLLVRNQGTYNYLSEFVLALSFMVVLLEICRKLPQNLALLKLAGNYSLQIMFFDSFNKVILFALLQRFFHMDLLLILIAVILNLLITLAACTVIKKIPLIRTLFGL